MPQKAKQSKKFLDISGNRQQCVADFDAAVKNAKSTSTLFSRGKRTKTFFTQDSKLYITPEQQQLLRKGVQLNLGAHRWDGLSSRVVTRFVRYQPSEASLLMLELKKRYEMFDEATISMARSFSGQFSMARAWNASIIGSILFGMVMMTFVYRYLGQGASAKQTDLATNSEQQQIVNKGNVLGVADTRADEQSFAKEVAQIEQVKSQQTLEKEIKDMVKGLPIEKMAPEIAKQDRTVAAFMVAIARKESSWGQRVPVLNGKDCFNYWGYRGIRDRMGTGGHTCFNSPEDAVETVAKRIATLVNDYDRNTPEEMVVWKCGNSCAATGGQAAANKWIKDVKGIFDEFDTKG
jgi:hypothetical protein